MRKTHRKELSEHALNVLRRRTEAVENSENKVERCQSLWQSRKNKAFIEIRKKLESSCSGRVRCMYCEDSEATDIEHFHPKSLYPLRAFSWENYLLACSNCNSNYKRTHFPTDQENLPLLINPMEEDPMEHLTLSLSTGKFIPATIKGEQSIRVFGLDRATLETGRRDAWSVLCALLLRYSQLDRNSSLHETESTVSALRNQSFSCVSLYARKYYQTGNLEGIAPADVYMAINSFPEILDVACNVDVRGP